MCALLLMCLVFDVQLGQNLGVNLTIGLPRRRRATQYFPKCRRIKTVWVWETRRRSQDCWEFRRVPLKTIPERKHRTWNFRTPWPHKTRLFDGEQGAKTTIRAD